MKDIPEMGIHSRARDISPTTKVATRSRCRRLERALHAVTEAIDIFPNGMLRLNSPAVLELRCPHVPDETYLQALQKIFPAAPSLLISALTAWIIVDLYFSNLTEYPAPSEQYWSGSGAAVCDDSPHQIQIPDKARDLLGIGLPDATSTRLNEHALRKRATAALASISVIGKTLIEALRGSWDEDIWRSLKVLVEVIEASPRPWG